MILRHPLILQLFRGVWRRRLRDGQRLRGVTGWRSCYYDDCGGQRVHATFCIGRLQ